MFVDNPSHMLKISLFMGVDHLRTVEANSCSYTEVEKLIKETVGDFLSNRLLKALVTNAR